MDELQVRSLEEAQIHINSFNANLLELRRKVRHLEELEDVMNTPLLKKIFFVVDGWPLFRVVDRPQWRPWRRWWTS